jgi:hypothetical protein
MKQFALVLFAALAVCGAPSFAEQGKPHEMAMVDRSKAQPPPAAPQPTVAEKAVLVQETSTAGAPDPGTAILMIVGFLALGWLAGRG